MPTVLSPHLLHRTAALLIALLAAGCQSGTPAAETAGGKASPLDRFKPFDSGGVDAAGTYVPSAAERALECGKLTGSMRVIIARLKDADNRPPPSALASGAQSAVAAVRGQPNQFDLSAEHARERARFKAYNGLLAGKTCPTLDLAKELAAPARK